MQTEVAGLYRDPNVSRVTSSPRGLVSRVSANGIRHCELRVVDESAPSRDMEIDIAFELGCALAHLGADGQQTVALGARGDMLFKVFERLGAQPARIRASNAAATKAPERWVERPRLEGPAGMRSSLSGVSYYSRLAIGASGFGRRGWRR